MVNIRGGVEGGGVHLPGWTQVDSDESHRLIWHPTYLNLSEDWVSTVYIYASYKTGLHIGLFYRILLHFFPYRLISI